MKNSISSHPEEGFNLLYVVLKEVIYDSPFRLKMESWKTVSFWTFFYWYSYSAFLWICIFENIKQQFTSNHIQIYRHFQLTSKKIITCDGSFAVKFLPSTFCFSANPLFLISAISSEGCIDGPVHKNHSLNVSFISLYLFWTPQQEFS